jgi:hypothetical protein
VITVAGCAALASNAAQAHHSQVFFDMSKCQTLVGTVRSFQFQFPHSWLWVVVPRSDGGEDVWGLEASAPVQMTEIEPRWKRDVVKKGDKVTVKLSPMKDGRTGGALASLTLSDGTVLRAATPACAQEMRPPSPATVAAPAR